MKRMRDSDTNKFFVFAFAEAFYLNEFKLSLAAPKVQTQSGDLRSECNGARSLCEWPVDYDPWAFRAGGAMKFEIDSALYMKPCGYERVSLPLCDHSGPIPRHGDILEYGEPSDGLGCFAVERLHPYDDSSVILHEVWGSDFGILPATFSDAPVRHYSDESYEFIRVVSLPLACKEVVRELTLRVDKPINLSGDSLYYLVDSQHPTAEMLEIKSGYWAGMLGTSLKCNKMSTEDFEGFRARKNRRASWNLAWSKHVVWRVFCSKVGLPRDVSDNICEWLRVDELSMAPSEKDHGEWNRNNDRNRFALSHAQYIERIQATLPNPLKYEILASHVASIELSACQKKAYRAVMEKGGWSNDGEVLGSLLAAINNSESINVGQETNPSLVTLVDGGEKMDGTNIPEFIRNSNKLLRIFKAIEKNELPPRTLFIVSNLMLTENLLRTLSHCGIEGRKAEIKQSLPDGEEVDCPQVVFCNGTTEVLCLEEFPNVLLPSFAALSPSFVAVNFSKVVVLSGCVAVMLDRSNWEEKKSESVVIERPLACDISSLLKMSVISMLEPEEAKEALFDGGKYDVDYLISRWSCEDSLLPRFFVALGGILGRYVRVVDNEVRSYQELPSVAMAEQSKFAQMEASSFTKQFPVTFAESVDVNDPDFWSKLVPNSNDNQ